jgi:hypothetical protein
MQPAVWICNTDDQLRRRTLAVQLGTQKRLPLTTMNQGKQICNTAINFLFFSSLFAFPLRLFLFFFITCSFLINISFRPAFHYHLSPLSYVYFLEALFVVSFLMALLSFLLLHNLLFLFLNLFSPFSTHFSLVSFVVSCTCSLASTPVSSELNCYSC